MKLWEAVRKLQATCNNFTYSESLAYLSKQNVDLIDHFDANSEADRQFIQRRCRKLSEACEAIINTFDVGQLMELKNGFSELLMFVKLRQKFLVKPVAREQLETPDYQIDFHGQDLFLEVKALGVVGGTAKHCEIMDQGLESKIDVEKQIDAGIDVAISPHLVQPHYRSDRPYDQYSTRMVTENIIDKVDQNISAGQFSLGSTFLLVDLCDELLLHGLGSENLEKHFGSPAQSGELWHAAFGELGETMFKVEDFEGANTQDGALQREGILRRFLFIGAVVFHYRAKFFGAAIRRRDNVLLTKLLKELCEKVKFELS
jgi:hypothetical protein